MSEKVNSHSKNETKPNSNNNDILNLNLNIPNNTDKELLCKPLINNKTTDKSTLDYPLPPFLPIKSQINAKKKTLLLDLDETLIHSGFFPLNRTVDISFTLQVDNQMKNICVYIRPGAREFINEMSKKYEVVIFTASLPKYANPIIDQLDIKNVCSHRLYREHCTLINNNYVKDLNKIGRELKDIILLDNSPISYMFNNDNGIPIKTWTSDVFDRELFLIIPLLEYLSKVNDVRENIKRMTLDNDFSMINAMKVKSIAETQPMPNKELNVNSNDKTTQSNNNTIATNSTSKVIVCRDSINCNESESKIAKSNNNDNDTLKHNEAKPKTNTNVATIFHNTATIISNMSSEMTKIPRSPASTKGNNLQLDSIKLIKINDTVLPKLINDSKAMITDKPNYSPLNNTTTNNNDIEKENYLKIESNDQKFSRSNFVSSAKNTVTTFIHRSQSKRDKESVSTKIIPKFKRVMNYQRNSEDITKMYFRHFNASSKTNIVFHERLTNLSVGHNVTKSPGFESFFLKKYCPNSHVRDSSSSSLTHCNNSNNKNKSIIIKPIFGNQSYKIA